VNRLLIAGQNHIQGDLAVHTVQLNRGENKTAKE
jgi:hypothetical protein